MLNGPLETMTVIAHRESGLTFIWHGFATINVYYTADGDPWAPGDRMYEVDVMTRYGQTSNTRNYPTIGEVRDSIETYIAYLEGDEDEAL